MAKAKVTATVDVTGNSEKVGVVWEKFADRWMFDVRTSGGARCQYEQDGRISVFSFCTDALAMSFARKCLAAGLKVKVYPATK